MKFKKIFEETTNRSVEHKARMKWLCEQNGLCPYCPPNSGCNAVYSGPFVRPGNYKSWKRYRKMQWKETS